jgi:uncharacterized protein (TIGR03437 family)
MCKQQNISWLIVCLLASIPAAGQTDVLTGGYDNSRSNANLSETVLNPSTVTNSSFGKLFSLAVDGQIYAQPLYLRNVTIPNHGTHNVIFVATMHDSVYAFDADQPGLPLWSVSLGTPVPTSTYASDDGPYTDINPENGILGTPVIDPSTGTLYAVAATYENGVYIYRLHALDVTSGQERFGAPSVITASVRGTGDSSVNSVVPFVAGQHLQRPALLLVNGIVYLAFGSHGDAPPYHGWVMSYSASDVRHQLAVYNPTPNGFGGSFWQSGRGLTVDDQGKIIAVASNGSTDFITSFSDSVLKLNPVDLSLLDWFGPYNVQDLNDGDEDLGAAGAVLLPNSGYFLTGGKAGWLYVIGQNSFGHESADDAQISQTFAATNFGLFNFALWNRSDGQILYTHGANEVVKSWKFSGSTFSTNPLAQSVNAFNVMFQGMTVSANGANSKSGILWVTQPVTYRLPSDGHLVAYDANTLSVLYDSLNNAADAMGAFTKFANPTVASGKVYVPTMSNSLMVYGLSSGATGGVTPSITAVVNAASYAGGAVAPGEIVALLGANLGPSSLAVSAFDASNQLPTQLAGTQVTFNGVPAPLLYSMDSAVAAIVPYEVAGAQNVTVQLTANSQPSAPQDIPLQDSLPGLFSADASGSGPGAILNLDYSLNSPDNPAAAGSIVIVYGTGGGATPNSRTGRLVTGADQTSATVSVTVNGQNAPVLYAGAAPGLVDGALQMNVQLPQGVTADVPIVVTVNGHASLATITVSAQ